MLSFGQKRCCMYCRVTPDSSLSHLLCTQSFACRFWSLCIWGSPCVLQKKIAKNLLPFQCVVSYKDMRSHVTIQVVCAKFSLTHTRCIALWMLQKITRILLTWCCLWALPQKTVICPLAHTWWPSSRHQWWSLTWWLKLQKCLWN